MSRSAGFPFQPGRRTFTGRGARSNESSRFDAEKRVAFNDGWEADEKGKAPKTEVTLEPAKSIITFNDSPFVGFDRSINPYRGCEHGCVYCFARPSHAYLGMSPGIDFERQLIAKPGAAQLLRKELKAKTYKLRTIAIGTNTDPYQPIEKRFRIMRQILEVMLEFKHPVSILTKSDLILRDLDILKELASMNLVRAMLSITTADKKLAHAMEPRAPTPQKRFEAVRQLSEAGIPTGTVHGPMIPGLSDHELEGLMAEARNKGARFTAYTLLWLPREVGPIFEEWLDAVVPYSKSKVLGHIRDINGGKLYDTERSRGLGPKSAYADLLSVRFHAAEKRLGFSPMPPMSTAHFKPPKEASPQADLFGENPP
ncbi:MAG: PA0069 family radical SAM protein [Pseudomonadota bacterium]